MRLRLWFGLGNSRDALVTCPVSPTSRTVSAASFGFQELEIQLATDAEGVGLRVDQLIAEDDTVADRPGGFPGVDIVEDALAIRIHVPVQTSGKIL